MSATPLTGVVHATCVTDRELLEEIALETVSSELYYDLADTISECTDDDLRAIIDCNGDYRKESSLQ